MSWIELPTLSSSCGLVFHIWRGVGKLHCKEAMRLHASNLHKVADTIRCKDNETNKNKKKKCVKTAGFCFLRISRIFFGL